MDQHGPTNNNTPPWWNDNISRVVEEKGKRKLWYHPHSCLIRRPPQLGSRLLAASTAEPRSRLSPPTLSQNGYVGLTACHPMGSAHFIILGGHPPTPPMRSSAVLHYQAPSPPPQHESVRNPSGILHGVLTGVLSGVLNGVDWR